MKMKNIELQTILKTFDDDMDVCILDLIKNESGASDEPNSEGIYSDIMIFKMFNPDELAQLQSEYPEAKNFIALQFEPEE